MRKDPARLTPALQFRYAKHHLLYLRHSRVPIPPVGGRMNPQEVLEYAKNNDAKQFDLRFTDIPSLQHHVSYPISELSESSFEEGFGMDGSSIRGWAAINESDMLLIPDPTTAFMDPFAETPTLVMLRRRHRPHHQAALRARPPLDRQESRAVPEEQRRRATRRFSAPKPSSSFSITSGSIRTSTPASISSTPKKAAGTPAARRTTWATGRATKKAISRCRPPIIIRICAARWCRP